MTTPTLRSLALRVGDCSDLDLEQLRSVVRSLLEIVISHDEKIRDLETEVRYS